MNQRISGDLLQWMRGFYNVVLYGNLSNAAFHMNIKQSAVSHHIRNLEKEFDTTLFYRENNRLILTEAGEILYRDAEKFFDMLERTRHALSSNKNDLSGTISMAMPHAIAQNLLPEVISKFHDKHEGVCFSLFSGSSKQIYEKVKNGMVHFGIVNQFDMTDHRDTALDITPLFGARLQIISSRNNHFSLPKEASIKSIEKFPFISFFPEYAVGSTISNYISKNNISLNTISYISSFNTLINMVKANIGISIIDSFAVKDDNDLCITNIIDEIPLRKYIMISKKNRYIPPQSIAFKELLFEFIPPKNCISLLP